MRDLDKALVRHPGDPQPARGRDGVSRLWACGARRDRRPGAGHHAGAGGAARRSDGTAPRLSRRLGRDSHRFRRDHRRRDARPLAPHSLRSRRRDDPQCYRAVPAGGRRQAPRSRSSSCAFAPDALWMLPGLWQILVSLGHLRLGALAAARRCARRRWYFVAGFGVLMLAGRRPRALALDDGHAVRRRPVAARRDPALRFGARADAED